MLVGYKPSPYVILKVAKTYYKSEMVRHTKSPEWNQEFEFAVHVPILCVLILQPESSDIFRFHSRYEAEMMKTNIIKLQYPLN